MQMATVDVREQRIYFEDSGSGDMWRHQVRAL